MSAEHDHPKSEVRVKPDISIISAPLITARELLGKPVLETRGLLLTKAPIHLFKVEGRGAVSEYGAVVSYPLDGHDLLLFLNAIAPVKRGLDRDGVVDDWSDIFENSGLSKLLESHQGMGKNWDVFAASRETLLDTVALDPKLLWFYTANSFVGLLAMDTQAETRFLRGIFDQDGPNGVSEAFINYLRNRYNFKDAKWLIEWPTDAIVQKVSAIDIGKWQNSFLMPAFLMQILSSDDVELKRHVADLANSSIGEERIKVGDNCVSIKIRNLTEGEINFTPNKRGQKLWTMDPKTIVTTNYVIPVLHWTNDGHGQRVWVDDFLDQDVAHYSRQFLEPVPDGLEFDNKRLNPLVGLGTIRYFSQPSVPAWPKYQSIKNGKADPVEKHIYGESNFMGPAQVLVLVKQMETSLMQEEFFAAAENHVEQHAL